jgi:hypothetical protein
MAVDRRHPEIFFETGKVRQAFKVNFPRVKPGSASLPSAVVAE